MTLSLTLEQLIEQTSDMVSLPQVSMRINEMVNSGDYKTADVGKLISQDAGLTVRLLKIANSPFYGLSKEVETVSRAVTILGSQQLRSLVLATSSIKAFEGMPNDLVSMQNFWFHNISCGLAAKFLSEKISDIDSESMFTAGLLHDIGQLVIFKLLSEIGKQAILMTEEDPDEPELYEAERKLLGYDHADVGIELLKQWNLPVLFQECAGFHHDIEKASEYPREVAIVHIANSIAVMAELNSMEDERPAINERAWDISGLDESIIESTMKDVQEQVHSVQGMLM